MENYQGHIFKGEFHNDENSFYLTGVKHMETQSTLSEKNVKQLYNYLKNHCQANESCTITINDQIPLLLSQTEANQLLEDLSKISQQF